jgi:hypothetical protein
VSLAFRGLIRPNNAEISHVRGAAVNLPVSGRLWPVCACEHA